MIYPKEMWRQFFSEVRGNPELERLATEALAAPTYTVTRKQHVLPKGGTPNDFVSIGPYWWPDPEKADGLPWIRRDGEINPVFYEYDSKTIFDFTTDVSLLLLAGLANDRQEWLDKAFEHIESWFITPATRMNPNMKYGQFVPGRAEGRCFGIIDGKELYWIFELLEVTPFSEKWTPEKLQAVKDWTKEMLHWLLTDPIGVEEGNTLNNHAISYDCMVCMFALFMGDREFAAKHLRERTIPRIDQQFAPDGSMPLELKRTDSKGYSTFGLWSFIQAAVMGRQLGVVFPDEMLKRGLAWLEANIDSPNWKWTQIVPFRCISPHLYQFAWMLWDDPSMLEKAIANSRFPWNRMLVLRGHGKAQG